VLCKRIACPAAGYEEQKQQIEDTVLLALLHPEVYNDIARATRRHYATNKPRAVLFEGPPGTGKTTSARLVPAMLGEALLRCSFEQTHLMRCATHVSAIWQLIYLQFVCSTHELLASLRQY
jgi:Cdc6-like AAA superfamily ATPase